MLSMGVQWSAARLAFTICFCLGLASCEKSRPPPNFKLLSTDMHISIAQHHLVLPFIALEYYGRSAQSFSLDRNGDAERAANALRTLMRESQDPTKPKLFDTLSVEIDTYGLDDGDRRMVQLCPMLKRQWARSLCDKYGTTVQMALPTRIELVDLRRLEESPQPRTPPCASNSTYRRPFPARQGEATMICELEISGGGPDEFHVAVVRIDGDLGATWTVWRHDQYGETAEEMMERQGKAIVALVRYGIGSREDFPKLHSTLCSLRRPHFADGADCTIAATSSVAKSTAATVSK